MSVTSAKPLLLESRGHGQAPGWRHGEDMIDALPYIDPLLPDIKRQVDALIDEELLRSTKRPVDYLKEMPTVPPPTFHGHSELVEEYERVKAKQPMVPLDTQRYLLNKPPQAKLNDQAAWRAALDNANAQLEHQYLRILNLELLLKYGGNVWRAQTQLSDATVKQYELELASTRKQIDAVNRERKLQQTAAGNELRKLDQEYMEINQKNLEIETACSRLEDEVYSLRSQLEKRVDTNVAAETTAANTAVTTGSAANAEVTSPALAEVAVNGAAATSGEAEEASVELPPSSNGNHVEQAPEAQGAAPMEAEAVATSETLAEANGAVEASGDGSPRTAAI